MKYLASYYSRKTPTYFVYMLQQVEYDPKKFINWLIRLLRTKKPLPSVMYRQELVITRNAKLMLISSYIFIFLALISVLFATPDLFSLLFGIGLLILLLPPSLAIFLAIISIVARYVIVLPNKKALIDESSEIFADTKATKIAVIGSYGKTTMKELLNTVLSEGKKVASTPGNMNVAVSHAKFARKLNGNEDIVIIEFGEGEPGDVEQMSSTVNPDIAVITGLAPNHLDYYPSVSAVADDLLSVREFVDDDALFITTESEMLDNYLPNNFQAFNRDKVLGWKISKIKIWVNGLSFEMHKGSNIIHIQSGLLGIHQVGPIAFTAGLADILGLTIKQIEAGCNKTVPFEHRMQPRKLHGAWLVDDTYNGSLQGMKAGLQYLVDSQAKRKWYVTPGLVDQGEETQRVHSELGKTIAEAKPDIVVLMDNSVRQIIENAMMSNGYKGQLLVEKDPLQFYSNIEHMVVAGDLVLMQNDWTDNYN